MAEQITVSGITVPLSHPDKVLFPEDGITKADPAGYYAGVADRMLPWLRDRIRRVKVDKEGGTDPWADFAGSARGLGQAGKRLAKLEA